MARNQPVRNNNSHNAIAAHEARRAPADFDDPTYTSLGYLDRVANPVRVVDAERILGEDIADDVAQREADDSNENARGGNEARCRALKNEQQNCYPRRRKEHRADQISQQARVRCRNKSELLGFRSDLI